MYIFDEHFVEEYCIEKYGLEGTIKQIPSRLEYLEKIDSDSNVVLFRFFDRKTIRYNGNDYVGAPVNYSDFIENNYIKARNDLLNQNVWLNSTDFYRYKVDKIISGKDYKNLIKIK